MNILAATAPDEAKDQVYNVAVGDRTTLNDLYKAIQSALSQANIKAYKEPLYREFRAGDVRHSQADIQKAKAKLGYSPVYNIKRGIQESVKWYLVALNNV